MFRARLLLLVAVTSLIAACSASPTSPSASRRYAPKAAHDGIPCDSTTVTECHSGYINPNG
jgi:ABC-type glycerol-3-phosphate transport system substrate-binding protein